MPIKWPALAISPHPDAPDFAADKNPQLLLQHLAEELRNPNFQITEKVQSLFRQAGLVSLWFYLKFIAGFSGPYDRLNSELHVDMANFRQRVATTPGIKAAGLVPRACFKSTIWSHGGNSWELVRNPSLRIGCTSEIYDRALGFVQTTISTFEQNEFHQWLYPEHRKANRDGTELILTSRKRRSVEPNLKAITAGGSTQGIHVDLFDCDDIVGDDMLNSDHAGTADMISMGNWLHENMYTLVDGWERSRVLVVGTRYAINDPYEPIMKHTREQLGFWEDIDYAQDPDGDWITYYRPAIQNEESINPEAFTVAALRNMLETNPWLAQTQYFNNPHAAGVADFATYRPEKVSLDWDDAQDCYVIRFSDRTVPLTKCDVVAGGDPAASEHRAGSRTSKSATGVIARTPDDRVVIIEADSGFVEPTKFFDWLFAYKDKYGLSLRTTYVEAQAGFKAFIPIGRREAALRGRDFAVQPIPALGDKETTIRNIYQPFLNRGKLYLRDTIAGRFLEEFRVFPSGRMDLLDALKIAIYKSYKPFDETAADDYDPDDDDDTEVVRRRRKRLTRATRSVSSISGY